MPGAGGVYLMSALKMLHLAKKVEMLRQLGFIYTGRGSTET
jgi:hypothetical protein